MSKTSWLHKTIGMLVEHYVIAKKYVLWLKKPHPPHQWKQGTKGDIVFLQGFNEGWVFASKLGNELNKIGYKIHHIKALDHNFYSLDTSIEIVKKYLQKQDLKNVVMISHSKGGLVGKAVLDDEKFTDKIRHLIAIAPPFKGTIFGYAAILSLHELKPYSKKIKRIVDNRKNYHKIHVLHSKIDNLVIPNSSFKIEGMKRTQLDTVGHTEILENKKTIEKIKEILQKVY
jgi:alpha-beta hydrolase superfamily lysophospholipase